MRLHEHAAGVKHTHAHRHACLPACLHTAQACQWGFLAFKGTFNVALNVQEQHAQRQLLFTLAESGFMRDFEGRWKVGLVVVRGGVFGV